MANVSKKPILVLSDKEVTDLKSKANSKTLPFREVQRAKVFYLYYEKKPIKTISSLTNLVEKVFINISKGFCVLELMKH